MPYVEGESLRDRLARQGELPVEETVRIVSELLDALAYAHQKGVVHRDIKPDNIMLAGRHALLLDFGVAKALSDSVEPAFVTTTGVALGTPSYMAPEQAVADKEVGPPGRPVCPRRRRLRAARRTAAVHREHGAGDRRGTDDRDADGPADASPGRARRTRARRHARPRAAAGRSLAERRGDARPPRAVRHRVGRDHARVRTSRPGPTRHPCRGGVGHSAAGRPCRRPGAPRPRGTRAPARPTDPAHPRPRHGDRAGPVARRTTSRLRGGAHALARDQGAPGGRRIPDRGGEGERASPALAIVVARWQPHHVRLARAASRSCPRSAGRRVSSCPTCRIRTPIRGAARVSSCLEGGRRTGDPSPSSGPTRLYLAGSCRRRASDARARRANALARLVAGRTMDRLRAGEPAGAAAGLPVRQRRCGRAGTHPGVRR